MTEYLVAVEHPTGYEGEDIVVTDNVEGFGPSLLAAFPIRTIEACLPQEAAYHYAREFGITHVLVRINLPDNDEEWWMCANELHKIDTNAKPVWESDKGAIEELGEFLTKVAVQYQAVRRDGGDHVDAAADILAAEGYTVIKTEQWLDRHNSLQAATSAAEESPPRPPPGRELFKVFITSEEMLCWETWDNETVSSMLADEAYGRWLILEPDKARAWEYHWEGHITVTSGGYRVRLVAKR